MPSTSPHTTTPLSFSKDSDIHTSILAQAGFAYVLKRLHGSVVEANDAALNLFGYTNEQFLTLKRDDFLLFDNATAALYEGDRNALKHQKGRAIGLRSDGNLFPVEFSSFAVIRHEEPLVCLLITEITDAQQVENLLSVTNSAAQVGGWEWNLVSQTIHWSPVIFQIHELKSNDSPAWENRFSVFKQGWSRSTFEKLINQALKSDEIFEAELEIIAANGLEKWVRIKGRSHFYGGKCLQINGAMTDIDRQKKRQWQLEQSRQQYLSLFRQNPDAVFSLDLDGRIKEANKAMCQCLELASEEAILGKEITKIIVPADTKAIIKALLAVQQGSAQHLETQFQISDAHYCDIYLTMMPIIIADRVVGCFCMSKNISQLKVAEQQLKSTAELLESITNMAKVGGFEIDFANNSAMCTTIAKEIYEVDGSKPPSVEKFIAFFSSQSVRDLVREKVNACIATGIPFDIEGEIITGKGRQKWIKTKGTATFSNGGCTRFSCVIQDIHETKQAQLALTQEKVLLRTLIDNIPMAIYVKDAAGRKLIANTLDVHYMGLESEAEALRKNDLEIFELQKEVGITGYEEDMAVLTTGLPLIEKSNDAINGLGNEVNVLVSKFPLKNELGQIVGLVGITRDVTIEKKLANQLKVIDFAFRKASISILLVKNDGSLYDANDQAYETLQYTREAFFQLKIWDIAPRHTPSSWKERWKELQVKQSVWRDSTHKRKDGIVLDMHVKTNLIRYGHLELACIFITDRSQLVEAAKALRISNERFENALMATSDVLWEADIENNTLFLSDRFTKVFGHKARTYEDSIDNSWSRNVHPDDLPIVLRDADRAIAGEYERWENEYRIKNTKGEYVLVYDRACVVKNADGKIIRLVGSLRNITAQKQEEERLKLLETVATTTKDAIIISSAIKNERGEMPILYVNHAFTSITGFEPNEVLGKDAGVLYEKLIDSPTLKQLQKATAALVHCEVDLFNYKKDGTPYWVNISTTPVADKNGQITHWISIKKDITERKTAELALQKSNERYEFAMMATSDAIWELDLEHNLLYLTENFCTIFGHHVPLVQEGKNNVWWQNIHPQDLAITIENNRRAVHNGYGNSWKNEYRFKKGNGEYAYILDKCFAVMNAEGKVVRMIGAMQDISVQKKEEQRLKLLETIITHSKDAYLVTSTEPYADVDLPIIYANGAFTEMTGYLLEEVFNKSPRMLQGPLTDRSELNKIKWAIDNWKPGEMEVINYKKNGEPFWVHISIMPVPDSKGWFTHWVSIQRDITKSKQNEDAFKKMSLLNRSILNGAAFSIISTDTNGVIKSFNAYAEKLLGYKAEEVIDQQILEIVHDVNEVITMADKLSAEMNVEIKPGFEVFIAKARNGSIDENDWTYIRKDGTRFPVRLSVTALYDHNNTISGFLGIAKDLIIETKIKQELQLSNNTLDETMFELKQQKFAIDQHSIVAITDVKGTIIYANENFCKISQYKREELIGQNHRIVKSGYHNQEYFTRMYDIIANGGVWQGEICNKAKDGSLYWVNTTIVPYKDAKTQKPIRYISIRTDITERKKAEFEREQLLEEITQSNKELKQFSYITTHNLRSPLTNLLGICALLDVSKIEHKQTAMLIEGFKKSTYHLNETLNDLINILIIKENRNLPTNIIDFNHTLKVVTDSIHRLIGNSGLKILADFSDLASVIFNNAYMESIFLNLITNAIKYAHPQRRPELVIVSSRNDNQQIQLVFRDNGIGMDMERVGNKIFGLYQRFHANSDSKGIGLYLIHSQITALGGTIEVSSQVNIGTTFTINFRKD